MKTFKEHLISIYACEEAIEWLKDRTPSQALQDCERGDWLLWWFARDKLVDKRTLTLAKARCAKLVIDLMKDKRSKRAVEVAEKYGLGKANDNELSDASSAAYAAYASSYASYASYASAYAAYASSYTASYASSAAAAYTASYASSAAAAYAADASDAASYAAAAYNGYSLAQKYILLRCADICRELFTVNDNYYK